MEERGVLEYLSAAFGRLRVETYPNFKLYYVFRSAAFGRLRVETLISSVNQFRASQPPSGGCVLKRAVV